MHDHLFVCLFVCQQNYVSTAGWIFIKIEKMDLRPTYSTINFGSNLDHRLDTKIFEDVSIYLLYLAILV